MSNKKRPYYISFFRFLVHSSAISKNPIPYHRDFFEESKEDTFCLKPFFTRYIYLTKDADFAKYILQKNHKLYEKSFIQTKYLSKYLGQGLLTATGNYWLQQRRLIQPAFHKEKLNSLIAIITNTVNEEIKKIKTDEFIDLYPVMNELAFKVVAKSLFNFSADQKTLETLQYNIEKTQHFLVKEIREPQLRIWYQLNGASKKTMQLVKESRAIINSIIEDRKNSQVEQDDLLDMLLHSKYEDGSKMTNEQLIDEILIIFVAGHETAANALTFTLFLLANHPTEQQKAYEEGKSLNHTSLFTINNLNDLNYTKSCVEESLRLYPPAWITDRIALEKDEYNGIVIQKGTIIGLSFYEINRNEKYWNKPESFDPNRFSEENRKESLKYFMPFGGGPRLCIGNNFAMFEMIIAIHSILNLYKIETNKKEVKTNPLITLKPLDVTLKFTNRQP